MLWHIVPSSRNCSKYWDIFKPMKYLSISCQIVFKPSDFPLHCSLKPFQTPFYFIWNDSSGWCCRLVNPWLKQHNPNNFTLTYLDLTWPPKATRARFPRVGYSVWNQIAANFSFRVGWGFNEATSTTRASMRHSCILLLLLNKTSEWISCPNLITSLSLPPTWRSWQSWFVGWSSEKRREERQNF